MSTWSWPTGPVSHPIGSGATCSIPRSLLPPRAAENERVDGLLELLRLTKVAKAPVAALPLGVVRLVEVGRALASEPHVLLLGRAALRSRHEGIGEPAVGLPPDRRAERPRRCRSSSSSTTWRRSWPSRTRSSSSTSASGSRRDARTQIRNDPAVRAAYLGDSEPVAAAADTAGRRTPEPAADRAHEPSPSSRSRTSTSATAPRRRCSGSRSRWPRLGPGRPRRQRRRQEHAGPCRLGPRAAARRAASTFDGHDITGLPAHHVRRLGLTYIPEGRGIFPGLSVIDNLRMAVAQEPRNERAAAIDRAIEQFPVLGQPRGRSAPAACPAASSRCWRWPGPWPSRPS